MRLFTITCMALTLSFAASKTVEAKALTKAEQRVCSSLKHCMDIVERHDASEFDYDVLAEEFRRFGPDGREALFRRLDSKVATTDIAKLLAQIGSLTQLERRQLKSLWSLETAHVLLPLVATAYPDMRNELYHTLAHSSPTVRENARQALLFGEDDPDGLQFSRKAQSDILSAMVSDPINISAHLIENFSAAENFGLFRELLKTGDTEIVSAAYEALFKYDRDKAFKVLLEILPELETGDQIRAVGEMLVRRDSRRTDGYYASFARELSADTRFSPIARATALHAYLRLAHRDRAKIPDLKPAQIEGLDVLLRDGAFIVQDSYGYVLPVSALEHVWARAQADRWINRGSLAKFYIETRLQERVVRDLLDADDFRSFRAGLKLANANDFEPLIRSKIDHPVKAIAASARTKLGLAALKPSVTCPIRGFDLHDMSVQMPFFETGWMRTLHEARVELDRKALATAHPTRTGWLAGYILDGMGPHAGGGIVHYDNQSGDFEHVGDFKSPIAVLPDKPLALGEMTDRFWVVDHWGGDSFDISAYRVEISATGNVVRHISSLPPFVEEVGLDETGNLLISFSKMSESLDQSALRLSPDGSFSSACLSG